MFTRRVKIFSSQPANLVSVLGLDHSTETPNRVGIRRRRALLTV